jgi:hypothetical protein
MILKLAPNVEEERLYENESTVAYDDSYMFYRVTDFIEPLMKALKMFEISKNISNINELYNIISKISEDDRGEVGSFCILIVL